MEQRKYESIVNIAKVRNSFNAEDLIHISEKIDGANASFMVDENGVRHFYSRNKELSFADTLRGFVIWADANIKWENVANGFICYGEWVVQHKISYNEDVKNTFVLFDIYCIETNRYLSPDAVKRIADFIGVKTPECFYYGSYQGLEHIKQFVGMSNITEKGEGVVIKNITQDFKCKWVREDFSEVKSPKQPKLPNENDLKVSMLIEQLLTYPRVEKILYKGLDEGTYDSFDTSNFGSIMKYMGNNVVEDIVKEESDMIPNELLEDFVKSAKKRIPIMTKEVINQILVNEER